jgi:hypothetical protein
MRPAVPPGFLYTGSPADTAAARAAANVAAAARGEDDSQCITAPPLHQGHAVPPRVRLETVETAYRDHGASRGGLEEFFAPRLVITAPQDSLFSVPIGGGGQQQQQQNVVTVAASSLEVPGVLWEETPLVMVSPPAPPEAARLGGAAASAAGGVQAQRSEFARMLAECDPSATAMAMLATPQLPEPSQFAVFLSPERRQAVEVFLDHAKSLWQMIVSGKAPSTGATAGKKKSAAASDAPTASSASSASGGGSAVSPLQMDPLAFTLQVAVLAQDMAASPYIGYTLDLLGGAARDPSARSPRLRLEYVFPSKAEARRHVSNAVLLHKLAVATCEPLVSGGGSKSASNNDANMGAAAAAAASDAAPRKRPQLPPVTLEVSDLAVLAHFAKDDGARLVELWPKGPLALFPVAAFATFVPMREAANAVLDLSTIPRAEDGDDPTLRVRCVVTTGSVLDSSGTAGGSNNGNSGGGAEAKKAMFDVNKHKQQQQQAGGASSSAAGAGDEELEALIRSMAESAANGGDVAAVAASVDAKKHAEAVAAFIKLQGQEVRLFRRPMNASVPDEITKAQAAARGKDPRNKIAQFMSGLMAKRHDPATLERVAQLAGNPK